LHSRGRRIFDPFQTILQQFVNIRFNTYQRGKVSGEQMGTVIDEVWKKGVSIENSVRTLKDTGIFS
jgi:hypothetical protein